MFSAALEFIKVHSYIIIMSTKIHKTNQIELHDRSKQHI
jgi:hypothetical protein